VIATLDFQASGDKRIVAALRASNVASFCNGNADAVVTVVSGDSSQANAFYVVFN
jgi:hypothetical protein